MPPTQNRRLTAEGQAAAARIAENRRLRDSGMTAAQARQSTRVSTPAPTVSAEALSTPVTPVTVPQPATASIPSSLAPTVSAVAQSTGNIIAAKTAEAAQLEQLRQEQSTLMGEESLSSVLSREQERLGLPDNLKAL